MGAMMSSWKQKYFSNIFFSIVLEDHLCCVFGRVFQKGKVVKTFRRVFKNQDKNSLEKPIIKYINSKSLGCAFRYVSFLLSSKEQGFAKKEKLALSDEVMLANIDKEYVVFTPNLNVEQSKLTCKKIGLDLLYSPFALMYDRVKNHYENKNICLYMYVHKSCISVMVFKQKELFESFFWLTSIDMKSTNEYDFFYFYINKSMDKFYNLWSNKNIILDEVMICNNIFLDEEAQEDIKNSFAIDVNFESVDTLELMCDLAVRDVFNEL
ncbi:MAG: hypothetical protein KGV58_01220 [Campylobacteraceae bacterium]|nr:hypothetical protein [Campylobacteraceae bacterium]